MSELKHTFPLPGGRRLELRQGDLTQENAGAIVNAANEHLAHGGGVAHAISKAAGPQLQAESSAWVAQHGPVPHDRPAYTQGHRLPARYVIHAVGPVWGAGDEDRKLAQAVRGSLQVAEELGLSSIAFPAISTGIFGFPKERAARIFCETIPAYFNEQPASGLREVRLVLFSDMLAIFAEQARLAFGEAG